MHSVGRRGFTLIELLVALVLLGVVTTGIYSVLVSNQRLHHAQTQRIDLQQNIRAAATILPAEFREIASTEGDIYAMSATEISMRAMRQFSVICQAPALGGASTSGLAMMVFKNLLSGAELAQNDSILLYYEGDAGSRNDDSWVAARIASIPTNAPCPDGLSTPGISFLVDLEPSFPNALQLNRAGAIPVGGPMRGFEAVRYALHQSPADTLWYLGLQVPGATIQPLIGPLSGSGGLTFRYFNANGVATAARDSVALIEITVRGRTADPVQGLGGTGLTYPVDSIMTRVALRNNRRF